MKRILYECPFVPAEWIAAHGFIPSRVYPWIIHSKMDRSPTGVCPYTRRLLSHFTHCLASAIILTTTCDQIRHLSEQLEQSVSCPVFLLHVPKTWQTVNAFDYYRQELLRLSSFLISLGGVAPSPERLKTLMAHFQNARLALLASLANLRGARYCEALSRFFAEGSQEIMENGVWQMPESISKNPPEPCAKKPMIGFAVAGSPLAPEDSALWDHMEKMGANLVLDATPTGECSFPARLDPCLVESNPSLALFEAHFHGIRGMFRRPNQEYFAWLKKRADETGIRGLILKHYAWCDTWHAEAPRLKDCLNLPFLSVEAGDEPSNNGHTLTRLEAFLETIHGACPQNKA